MKTKDDSVKLDNLHPKMRTVLKAVDIMWKQSGQEAVITAGTEVVDSEGNFVHSAGSLHPFGCALDFRTNYFADETKRNLATRLRDKLGRDYDVILHTTHIHIEYDPK